MFWHVILRFIQNLQDDNFTDFHLRHIKQFILCISVPSASSEALAWRCAELPVDGQAVSLLASVVKDPQEFYCHISNGEGTFYLLFTESVKVSLNFYSSK